MQIQDFIELSRVFVWPVLIFIIILMYGEYIRKLLDRIVQGPLNEVITSVATLKFGAKEIAKSSPRAGLTPAPNSGPNLGSVDPECVSSLLAKMAGYDLQHFLRIANKNLTLVSTLNCCGGSSTSLPISRPWMKKRWQPRFWATCSDSTRSMEHSFIWKGIWRMTTWLFISDRTWSN